jgi:hypothetical protein
MFVRALKFAFMPAVRVAEQARQSGQRLRSLRRAHLAFAGRSVPNTDLHRAPDSQEMLAQSGAAQRFKHLYEARGWNEQMLARQALAVCRARRAALLGCLIGACAALVLVLMAPLWALALLVPASAGLTSFGFAMALKFALFQAQLEQRALISLRQYLSRDDLLGHLLGWGPRRCSPAGGRHDEQRRRADG